MGEGSFWKSDDIADGQPKPKFPRQMLHVDQKGYGTVVRGGRLPLPASLQASESSFVADCGDVADCGSLH